MSREVIGLKLGMTGGNSLFSKELRAALDSRALFFGRQNGYDIGSAEVRRKIVEASHSCDLFINYAHNGHLEGQARLLIDLFEGWSQQNKTGLIVTFGTSRTYDTGQGYVRYAVIKKVVEILHQQCCDRIRTSGLKFRMTHLRPGLLRTERTFNSQKGLSGSDIASVIKGVYQLRHVAHIEDLVVREK